MYVCICNGVTDGTIVGCIKGGAKSMDAVAMETGAGTVCGGCRPLIDLMLADEQQGTLVEGEYDYSKLR
jgi:bacterioferritin-associated ferredoxin